jgi:acetate CoA/acetoacetate CoA-transferase alpha subunit
MKTARLEDAVARIPDGASLMVGGFMRVGTPERLMDELVRQGKRNLTVIANDTAMPGVGIGKLVNAKLLRKVITSHIGLNPETQQKMMSVEIEVELVPQGTLIERIRAGGYDPRRNLSKPRFDPAASVGSSLPTIGRARPTAEVAAVSR